MMKCCLSPSFRFLYVPTFEQLRSDPSKIVYRGLSDHVRNETTLFQFAAQKKTKIQGLRQKADLSVQMPLALVKPFGPLKNFTVTAESTNDFLFCLMHDLHPARASLNYLQQYVQNCPVAPRDIGAVVAGYEVVNSQGELMYEHRWDDKAEAN